MYAMHIQNDVIGLMLCEHCKSKQMTDFIAWPSRCHDTIYDKTTVQFMTQHIFQKYKENNLDK